MKTNKSIFYSLVLLVVLLFATSCKYSNQQNKMLDALENSGVEVPEEMRDQSSLVWADIFFPLSVVFGLGLISIVIYLKVKRSKSDFGYAISNIRDKMDSLKDGDEMYDQMSEEERKEVDTMRKLFTKKPKKND